MNIEQFTTVVLAGCVVAVFVGCLLVMALRWFMRRKAPPPQKKGPTQRHMEMHQ